MQSIRMYLPYDEDSELSSFYKQNRNISSSGYYFKLLKQTVTNNLWGTFNQNIIF